MPLHQGSKPLKRRFPVFELPDIVLDLDAEGSPHVRPFDAHKDGPFQEAQWGYDPVIDEVKRDASLMKQTMRRDLSRLKAATQVPFSGERLSDLDIMTAALMNQSSNVDPDNDSQSRKLDTFKRRDSRLQNDLIRNGIPKAIGRDATHVIPFMLHRRQLALEAIKDPSKRGPSGGDDESDLNRGIAGCRDLAQLRRLCSRIDRPESGVEFSAASIDHVHAHLLVLLQSGEEGTSAADILKFVNNVTINRLSANKELNRSMTLLGLQLASELSLLSCILQYLQICLSMSFITSRDDSSTLTRSHVGMALLAALQRGEATARGTRQQIFTLLTGRGPSSLPPMPCLFGLVAEDHVQRLEVFKLSARLLGELGALRLLMHHWRQRAQQFGITGQPMESGQQLGHEMQDLDEVFAEAFQRCIQVLSGGQTDDISMDLTTVTGNVEKDAGLDLQNINVMEIVHARRETKGSRPSPESIGKPLHIEEIKDAFNEQDMRTSMGRFQKLIERAAIDA